MFWVLGALCLGAAVLVFAAFVFTDFEIDEVLDDSLRQTALLLADRDLAGAFPSQPSAPAVPYGDTESMLVAIARRPDGTLLFTSQPELTLSLEPTPGASIQTANSTRWHVFTVVQPDRTIQVAQPSAARREVAAESASELAVPLIVLVVLIGTLIVLALRRGIRPLAEVSAALSQRSATSLTPLDVHSVPTEVLPLVRTLNDLLQRVARSFETQRNFVSDAAHELRSPVTALQLQVQLLERSTDPATHAAATAELGTGISRTRHLIEQLLFLSRAAAENGEEVRLPLVLIGLGDLARDAVVQWSAEAERRRIDLGAIVETEVDIVGERSQLEVLLNNLIDNALRYTPADGIVDVAVSLPDGAPTLRVIDSGPGVPETERARVFDRFYRSPQAATQSEIGSGLGLAIVKAIADRHGAHVSLHSGRDGIGLEARVVFAEQTD